MNFEIKKTSVPKITFEFSLAQDMGISEIMKVLLTVISLRTIGLTQNQKFKRVLKFMMDFNSVRALAMSNVSM